MYVSEASCWWCEFSQWCDRVTGDFGTLACLAGPCPGTAIFLDAWPHEALRE
jgi:hypothetical protein